MHIREFNGADFDFFSRLLGRLWHSDHGSRSYWQGSDELCEHLSQTDKGFVAVDDDGVPLGIILLKSPQEEPTSHDQRMHWLQQRTRIAAMASTLGIEARADAAILNEENEAVRSAGELEGADGVGEVVLVALAEEARGKKLGRKLLREGLLWLAERGAHTLRLVTDNGCDWQFYEHLQMRRVLQQESTSVEDCTIYVYDAPIDELLARLGEDNCRQKAEAQPTWRILPSEEDHDAQVGSLLDAHAQAQGREFRTYRHHIEDDGRLIAGITAWSLGPELHVDTLAVDETYRRKGLGRRLLEHVEQEARKGGCTTASVDTFSFQAPDYYPALGYEEQFRYALDDGTERIFFRKRL